LEALVASSLEKDVLWCLPSMRGLLINIRHSKTKTKYIAMKVREGRDVTDVRWRCRSRWSHFCLSFLSLYPCMPSRFLQVWNTIPARVSFLSVLAVWRMQRTWSRDTLSTKTATVCWGSHMIRFVPLQLQIEIWCLLLPVGEIMALQGLPSQQFQTAVCNSHDMLKAWIDDVNGCCYFPVLAHSFHWLSFGKPNMFSQMLENCSLSKNSKRCLEKQFHTNGASIKEKPAWHPQ
jgi:hypothetical protein